MGLRRVLAEPHYAGVKTLLWLVVLGAGGGQALHSSRLYPYGTSGQDQRLAPADETASTEFHVRTPIVYYGQKYKSLFVNMNGFVSFLTEIPSFFNIQFPLDYPVIAGLYSDVDTSESGAVWYRETSDPATLQRVQAELAAYFSAAASFQPSAVVVATWEKVPGHGRGQDGTNFFQVIIASDGTESYVVIMYADGGVQWLRGSGKNPSLPDALGQAGFLSGDGRMKTLPGSGRDQVRNLDKWSNVGEPGVWVHRVGQISTTDNVAEPDLVSTPPPDSTCSVGGLQCHSSASCRDVADGFCCSCPRGTYGNGENCVSTEEPVRVTGRVSGALNGAQFQSSDLHSYVLTAEGRTYTAVSRVGENQGFDMQMLLPIGTGISWLFSKPTEKAQNGFTITGGLLNRTVTLDFPQTGHSASVQQFFKGLDAFENVEVDTVVDGTLPSLPVGAKIVMDPFEEEYTRVSQGQLRSRSNRVFRLEGQELETPFVVETTVDYDSCAFGGADQPTLRLKVEGNVFIQYDGPEKIVRYALTTATETLSEEDPCTSGKLQCGTGADCIVEAGRAKCVCARGYERHDTGCVDLDECLRYPCDPMAKCANVIGSYVCTCSVGYTGDGHTCTALPSCQTAGCDAIASCTMEGSKPVCRCPPGMEGDGRYCLPVLDMPPLSMDTCGGQVCSADADCHFYEQSNLMMCACRDGYIGDGLYCEPMAMHGVHVDQIPEYILGPGHDNVPVVFEENPNTIDGMSGNYYFDGDSLRPTRPVDAPIIPAPYVPPQTHETPLMPYQPDVGAGNSFDMMEPTCVLGTCFCPPGFKLDTPSGNCTPKSYADFVKESELSATATNPTPFCGAAECTCPEGFLYVEEFDKCERNPAAGLPQPNCSEGQFPCLCPAGFHYTFPQNKCQPNGEEDQAPPMGGESAPFPGFEFLGGLPDYPQYGGEARPIANCDMVENNIPCFCPTGFDYNEPKEMCLPTGDPKYNYNIHGGATDVLNLFSGDNKYEDLLFGILNQTELQGVKIPEGYDLKDIVKAEGGVPQTYPGLPHTYPGEPQTDPGVPQTYPGSPQTYPGSPQTYPAVPQTYLGVQQTYPGVQQTYPGVPHTYHGVPQTYPGNPRTYPGNPQVQPGASDKSRQPAIHSNQPGYVNVVQHGNTPQHKPKKPHPYQDVSQLRPGFKYPENSQLSEHNQYPENTQLSRSRKYPKSEPFSGLGAHQPSGTYPQPGTHSGRPQELSCELMDVCHEFATCIYQESLNLHLCICNKGFAGDGISCQRQDFSCDEVNICHVNAECVHDDLEMRSVCRCLSGHMGDGLVCSPEDQCGTDEDCDVDSHCVLHSVTDRYQCECREGFNGDGRNCVAATEESCNVVGNCHYNANCIFDRVALTHYCECKPGFEGDGISACNEIQVNCKVLRNCGPHADCQEISTRDHRCVCEQGYSGDGYYCQPMLSCKQDPSMCHEDASCEADTTNVLGFSCLCSGGFMGDGFTCTAAPQFEKGILLLNQGLSVLRMPTNVKAIGGGYPIAVDPFMSAVGADVDCFSGRYYWTDVRTGSIRSCKYDGSDRNPFVTKSSGVLSPEDVAVDWISGNVYWTDSAKDEISAQSIEGGLMRMIITGGLVNPRGIAVHPGRGLLFWSDWNRDAPKIESSGLDGSDRKVLVDTDIELPNSLVVDYDTSTLCWADAGTHKIECMSVTGRDRRTVIRGPAYPFGLTVHHHHFYYTDWEDSRIHAVNKFTGREDPSRPAPPGGSGRLYGIAAVPDTCPPVSNACQTERGGCDADKMCLPNSSGGRVCACPGGEGGDGVCLDTME